MKRTLSKLLGIAALVLAGFTGLASSPAMAYVDGPAIVKTNTTGSFVGTWSCIPRTGGTVYAENGKYFYCGNPTTANGGNFEGNYNSHRNGYMTKLTSLPAVTTAALNTANVKIYVFCTAREYEIYFNKPLDVSVAARRSITSFFDRNTKEIIVFQYLTSAGQSCSTTTGIGAANKFAIWLQGYGYLAHEVGHYVDDFLNVPAGQFKHSVDTSTKLFRKYLQKDIDWLNDPTIHSACTMFGDPVDIWDNAGVDTPVCVGTVRNAHFAGKTNFQVIQEIINLPYYLKIYSVATNTVPPIVYVNDWRELFPELLPWANNTPGYDSDAGDKYFGGSYFLCAKRYVEIVSKTGGPPQPADLVSPYNRCVLAP